MKKIMIKLNLFKFITLCLLIVSGIKAKYEGVEYNPEGVLRKDSTCNINFINFGIEENSHKCISDISVTYSNKNLKIEKLKNGNEGLNSKTSFTKDELPKYIKIFQNGQEITQNVSFPDYKNGYFSIEISNLKSCEGITVKQTYKEPAIMHTYLLYENKVPSPINKGFPSNQFGPSKNDIPYSIVNWDMNEGLDEVREKCGIYIQYRERGTGGGNHFVWYLSIENINNKKCTNTEFYNIAKKHYNDYYKMEEIFGDHYEGYVIKRETGSVGHMDGVIVNRKYIIEMYQKACGKQNGYQVICTIPSVDKLTFSEFTNELINNCLSVIIDKEEKPKYIVNSDGITMNFQSYSIKIVNNSEGKLPTSESETVVYKEFSGVTSSGIARFSLSLECYDGSYSDEKCRCHGIHFIIIILIIIIDVINVIFYNNFI